MIWACCSSGCQGSHSSMATPTTTLIWKVKKLFFLPLTPLCPQIPICSRQAQWWLKQVKQYCPLCPFLCFRERATVTVQNNLIRSPFKILRIFSITFVGDSEQRVNCLGVVYVLAEISITFFCRHGWKFKVHVLERLKPTPLWSAAVVLALGLLQCPKGTRVTITVALAVLVLSFSSQFMAQQWLSRVSWKLLCGKSRFVLVTEQHLAVAWGDDESWGCWFRLGRVWLGESIKQRSLTNLVQRQENTNVIIVQVRDWPVQQIAVYAQEKSLAFTARGAR